ncbi:hypothetical protein EJ07DRAFT_150968 [Lizonia empirigonia]|nr:hypothetical protein EJ07DRAFT_150968 [Lizonia empirigonia]
MAPTSCSRKAVSTAPKHFEEYGLRIPQIRRGQKVAHARLASELATSSKERLSAIVNDFLQNASKATKLIKTLHSKSAIADWIEKAETLALGPHPRSELNCQSIVRSKNIGTNRVAATKKEDLIKALGLATTAQKVKGDKVKKETKQRMRPGQKQPGSPSEEQEIAQSKLSFSPKAAKSERRKAPVPTKTAPSSQPLSPPKPKLDADQRKASFDPASELVIVTENTNKRKYDDAAETAESDQTPKKKTKVPQAVSSSIDTPLPMIGTVVSQALVIASETSAPISNSPQASRDREVSPVVTRSPHQIDVLANQDISLQDPVPDPKTNGPLVVIHLSNEDFLVTHASLKTCSPEVQWQDQSVGRLETLDGDQTFNKKQDEVLYFASSPDSYDGDACPSQSPEETPFLKNGRHGRHGDFVDDPDLHTGRGHQVESSDLVRKREYEAKYHEFYKRWPHYPYVDRARRYLTSEDVEGGKELDEAERWMMGYREKYQGENVGHLWPCGCERLVDGDESEEE